MMQALWQCKITWDETVPSHILNSWTIFRTNLTALNQLRIPRHMSLSSVKQVQIHLFCDASERAYIRCVSEDQVVECNLMCAKTRVEPLKATSYPASN